MDFSLNKSSTEAVDEFINCVDFQKNKLFHSTTNAQMCVLNFQEINVGVEHQCMIPYHKSKNFLCWESVVHRPIICSHDNKTIVLEHHILQ